MAAAVRAARLCHAIDMAALCGRHLCRLASSSIRCCGSTQRMGMAGRLSRREVIAGASAMVLSGSGFAYSAAIARGVVFEDYDLPGLKTVGHVCVLGSEKAAWFKDTEGNYLCIHEDLA